MKTVDLTAVCNFQEKSDKEKEEIEEEEKRFEGSGYDRDLIEILGKCLSIENVMLKLALNFS